MSLILASQSRARQQMLRDQAFDFKAIPAELDEESIIQSMMTNNADLKDMPMALAQEKALFISNQHPQFFVIGSDQVLIMDEKIFSKVITKEEAIDRLTQMQGRDHHLISSVAVAKNNQIIFKHQDNATLTMKPMTLVEIEDYIHQAEDDVYHCVGCYALEGLGKNLFEKIDGDFHTILGMPLMPLLDFLKTEQVAA